MKTLTQYLPLLFLISLAFVLRLPLLTQSFWLDEAAQALQSARPWSEQLNIPYDFQPPLLHVLTHFMLKVSPMEWWLRMTSVTAGVVSVAFTYLMGKKFLSEKMSIVAGALMATNSLHIYFSQELRSYSLACMFGVMSWYFLLRIVGESRKVARHSELQRGIWQQLLPFRSTLSRFFGVPQNDRKSGIDYLMYTLASLGGFYSMYLYPFLFLAQVIAVIFFYRSFFKQFVVSWFFVMTGFAPWLPKLFEQLQVSQALRANTQGWEDVVSFDQTKSIPMVMAKFLFGVSDLEVNIFYIGFTLILSFIFIQLIRIQQFKIVISNKKVQLLLVQFVIPLLFAWIISFWTPLIQPKRVLFLLPSFILLLCLFIHQAKISVKWKYLIVSIFLFLNLFSLFQYWSDPKLQREDWRGVISEINQQFSPSSSVIVFGFDEAFAPWNWYQHNAFPIIATGTKTISTISDMEEKMIPSLNYEYVIVFDYLRDLTDPNRRIEQWLNEYGYQDVGLLERPNIGFIRVFQKGKEANVAYQIIE